MLYMSKVYFYRVSQNNLNKVPVISRKLLEKVIEDNKIILEKEIPLKIHPGQPGNVTYIKPGNFSQIINFLKERKIKTYFIESGMVTGPRSKGITHRQVAKKHGFTQIPFVVADGENGKDSIKVKISSGKHLKSCLIAKKLAQSPQIIVLSHFKGHSYTGFGGAIKMLGIGFASRNGKMDVHSKNYDPSKKTIDWTQIEDLYQGKDFWERMADYAFAAVNKKKFIYLNFALSITLNCDCDGEKMKPIYKDLGIFASLDPVAIDKACFDLLEKREGKKPFKGEDVFMYSEKIGLGSQKYELITLSQ